MRAVLCGYSRLLIDCNRTLDDPSSIPESVDGIAIPGNCGLSPSQREARATGIFKPYHGTITAAIDSWLDGHARAQDDDPSHSSVDGENVHGTEQLSTDRGKEQSQAASVLRNLPIVFSIHSMTSQLKVRLQLRLPLWVKSGGDRRSHTHTYTRTHRRDTHDTEKKNKGTVDEKGKR